VLLRFTYLCLLVK